MNVPGVRPEFAGTVGRGRAHAAAFERELQF